MIKLPNRVEVSNPGEKETYKYLGILEAKTHKKTEMREKIKKKNTLGERGNYSKSNYIAEIFSKE